jgi:rhomboid protease GluP
MIGRSRWVAMGSLPALVVVLLVSVPAPSYRWREELQARAEIRQFQHDDRRILERWQQILDEGKQGNSTFEQLAGKIENDVTREYRDSFEHLSALQLDPAAPSTTTLDILRTYAQLRGDAAHSLTEALRSNDPERIRETLERARRVPYVARGASPSILPAPAH